jgi:hypothetical protein
MRVTLFFYKANSDATIGCWQDGTRLGVQTPKHGKSAVRGFNRSCCGNWRIVTVPISFQSADGLELVSKLAKRLFELHVPTGSRGLEQLVQEEHIQPPGAQLR